MTSAPTQHTPYAQVRVMMHGPRQIKLPCYFINSFIDDIKFLISAARWLCSRRRRQQAASVCSGQRLTTLQASSQVGLPASAQRRHPRGDVSRRLHRSVQGRPPLRLPVARTPGGAQSDVSARGDAAAGASAGARYSSDAPKGAEQTFVGNPHGNKTAVHAPNTTRSAPLWTRCLLVCRQS